MKPTTTLLLPLLPLSLAQTTTSTTSRPTTAQCPDGSPSRTFPYGAGSLQTATACCPGDISAIGIGDANSGAPNNSTNNGAPDSGPSDGSATPTLSYNLLCIFNCETAFALAEGSTATPITSSDCRSATVGAEDYTRVIYGGMTVSGSGTGSKTGTGSGTGSATMTMTSASSTGAAVRRTGGAGVLMAAMVGAVVL